MRCGEMAKDVVEGTHSTLLAACPLLGLARSGGPFVGLLTNSVLVILVDRYDLSISHTYTSVPISYTTTTSTL